MGFQVMEIARRDLVLHYLKVARGDLIFHVRIKGIARWDSKLKEIARRDLVFCYLEVARWDLVLPVEKKRNRQMGFQVD